MNPRDIDKTVRATNITITAVTAAATFSILVVTIMIVWAWVIPDLFPGLVEEAAIASRLNWIQASGLAVLAASLASAGKLLIGAVARLNPITIQRSAD